MTDDDFANELGLAAHPSWLVRVPVALRGEIASLRERRKRELRAAIDRAMEHVPRLLRGALRKVLFP